MVLNSKWNKNNKDRVLHRHICFFGTMKEIFDDCCGLCPEPNTPEEFAAQLEDDKIFIRGKMEFIKDDPGRQTIGSFHPLTDDDWTSQAYITNVRVDLCSACVRGDVDIVENILKQNSLSNVDEDFQVERVNIESRDYLGRTPLQLAVLGGHTELVKILLKYDARIIARMSDGKTVVHLASQYGFLDILELLIQKSNENKEKAQEQKDIKSLSETNNQTNDEIDNSFEIIDKSELDFEDPIFDPIDKENDQDDIIDINAETWDHLLTALDYAILFGHVEIVKRLIKAGANVQRQIKIKVRNNRYYYGNTQNNIIYYPLGLSLLTQDQKYGLEIASILLKHGANVSQVLFIFFFFFIVCFIFLLLFNAYMFFFLG
jgi:ankyrin repeat protein